MNVTIQVDWWTVAYIFCGLMYFAAIIFARNLMASGTYNHNSDEDRFGMFILLAAAPVVVPFLAVMKLLSLLYDGLIAVIGIGLKRQQYDSFGNPFPK